MLDYRLSAEDLNDLRRIHRTTRDKRAAYRINAVILLASGWSAEQVAQALLIDADTVRNYFKRYRQDGVEGLLHVAYRGADSYLDGEQLVELKLHLKEHPPLCVRDVISWVATEYGVRYTESGMTALLHRLGFVYKKGKIVPGKADPEKQEDFIKKYENIKENKGENDPIYFIDAVHPQHNPTPACAWIERGEDYEVRSNTGRNRLNINGAINIETLETVVNYETTINAESTIDLLTNIEERHQDASRIFVICDNAPYYRSKLVREFLEDSKIELVFLPAYSPNLNLIERLWKFFKKKITYNRYYETFECFKDACRDFFKNIRQHELDLRSLLTENFHIIGQN